ncbi:uncharacterized protein LOC108821563 [Raphanus sativus]|uniref:Uncharacterized protein LOC108821563 n=1 Tax=Raphanus sativus TaxID=3726 RepID=A0A9W3C9K9_RAPSA|nr:uncharacterized protein LOC108821563 [Raphanus sativus]
MSHGDEAVELPDGFEVVARSSQGDVSALENRERRIYGLQYHPEVASALSISVIHSVIGLKKFSCVKRDIADPTKRA